MSKKDNEINRQLIFNSGGANPEDYLTPKQLERYNKNRERFIDIDIDLAMNKEDDLTQKDIDDYNKRRKEEYDDANNPKDPNTLEEELKKKGPLDEGSSLRQSLSIGTEVGLNTLLDLFSFEPGSQIAGGTVINYLAQRIRGGEISQGELVASGLASLIPGGAQGKALTRLAKASGKGAVSGGIQTTSMTAIDEGRLPTGEELGTGLAVGGAFGGLFQAGTELTPALLKNIKNRITKDSVEVFAMSPKGTEDPTGAGSERFNYGEDVLGNLPPKTLELLKKNKFTTNQSKLLISNFNKPIPRDLSATITSLFNTVDDFNSFKQTMLPVYLESMSKVRRTKTPQADHIAQLRAALPFFYGKPVELWPQISDIIVKEGVFGLGHNNKNLVFLEFPVHTVKTAFWKEQVGDAGEKFFAGRTLDTPDEIRAAAKEFAKFIRKSNKVVNDAVEQYNFMNQKQIDQDELVEFIDRLGTNPLEAKYSIKQVKDILNQMEEDGFKATSKESQAAETKVIKSEQKTAKERKARQAKIDQEFQKSVVESETYRKYYASDEGKFKSPLVKGSKDDMLITHAEDIYEEMSVDKNPETRDAMIKKIMKIIKPRYKG